MISVEFWVDHVVLREALSTAPDTTIDRVRTDIVGNDELRISVWTDGGDPGAFEDALQDDSSAVARTRVAEVRTPRLSPLALASVTVGPSLDPIFAEAT